MVKNEMVSSTKNEQIDGRTAKYRVDRLSGIFHTLSSSYYCTFNEAEAAMEMMKPLTEKPNFGDDLFLQKRSGNSWSCIKRFGNHTV